MLTLVFVSLYLLENIHALPATVPDYGLYDGRKLEFNKAVALADAATDARHYHDERRPSNFLLSELTGHQGIKYARSLIMQSTMMGTDELQESNISPEAWLGVLRENHSIAGAILVQRSIKVKLENEVVIEEGTCVEGFVVDRSNRGLTKMYNDGLFIAEAIADGQPIFSIESAPRTQSFFEKLKEGRLSFDDDLIKNMGTLYAYRTDAENFVRSDMPEAAQVPKFIYSNTKI